MAGDYSTAAFNPLRDTIFQGNQQAWDIFGTVAIAATAIVSVSAGVASAVAAAGQAGSSVTQAVVVFGAKTLVTAGAGMLGGWAGKEIALELGASETIANIVGVLSGTAVAAVVGLGANAVDKRFNLSGYHQQPLKPPDLPEYNGQKTEGVLQTPDGQEIPLESGGNHNYPAGNHVEGKAAQYMNENGITEATVYHNNPSGTCNYCDKQLPTLLDEGSTLHVVPPPYASAPTPRWFDQPKTYTGNSNIPKI